MTLSLNAEDVDALFDMNALIAALEAGLREQARGHLQQPSRLNVQLRYGMLRMMPAALNESGLFGFKAFHWTEQGGRFLIAVYEQDQGELLALVDGNYLTAARTGATAAVATKYLAAPDACRLAVIGSGVIARTSLEAIRLVRPVRDVWVYSPNPARRSQFASWAKDNFDLDVTATDDPISCVDGAEIVVVATNTSRESDHIAFRGAWMAEGVHVNSIGSTMPYLREIDTEAFACADLVVVDAPEQMGEESGDVIAALAEDLYGSPSSLHEIVGGIAKGREGAQDMTLFKSVGTGMQDVVAGHAIYEAAVRTGRGIQIDLLNLKTMQGDAGRGNV